MAVPGQWGSNCYWIRLNKQRRKRGRSALLRVRRAHVGSRFLCVGGFRNKKEPQGIGTLSINRRAFEIQVCRWNFTCQPAAPLAGPLISLNDSTYFIFYQSLTLGAICLGNCKLFSILKIIIILLNYSWVWAVVAIYPRALKIWNMTETCEIEIRVVVVVLAAKEGKQK